MMSRSLARIGRMLSLAALLSVPALGPALAGGGPVPDPLPFITDVAFSRSDCDTCAPRACPGEGVHVTVSGSLPAGCYHFVGLRQLPLRIMYPVVEAAFLVDTCGVPCPRLIAPFSGSIDLPTQPAGQQTLVLRAVVRSCPDSSVVDSAQSPIGFDVQPCPNPPIPVDSLVRTFVKLAIVPEHPCAGDTVTLQLIKNGCPPCVHLVSFGDTTGGHGRFEGVIDWRPNCREFACIAETLSTSMGRLAAGSFRVLAPMTVHVLDTPNPDSTIAFTIPFEFQVGQDCGGPPPLCVAREMVSDAPGPQCALTLPPGGTGVVPLYYSSDLAMAGVQGVIEVPALFQLTDLKLASGLTGVQLVRQRVSTGFRWLVFTDPGVVLAPGPHQHLLDAEITAGASPLPGASAFMTATITLASNEHGDALPLCNRESLAIMAVRLCIAGDPSACDVNHDGRLDVRDLVRLVGCLRHDLVDTTRTCVDCDSSGAFDIADIFCCARSILRGPLVPSDSVHHDGNVSVSLGPVWSEGPKRIVHVRVTGARALGATLLRLDYPAERWRADARLKIARPQQPVDNVWYQVMDLEDPGHVNLATLRLGDAGYDDFEFEVVMEPIGTPLAEDRLVAVGADLAGLDGAVITPAGPLPALGLTAPAPPEPGPGQPASLELSAPRPNPFTTSTSFEVALPNAAPIDLAVHDLAGRRVATLATGVYPSGRWTFHWDGAGARGGVYYVRLKVNGAVRSTRVALLRNAH
jgi:hypothetical protein